MCAYLPLDLEDCEFTAWAAANLSTISANSYIVLAELRSNKKFSRSRDKSKTSVTAKSFFQNTVVLQEMIASHISTSIRFYTGTGAVVPCRNCTTKAFHHHRWLRYTKVNLFFQSFRPTSKTVQSEPVRADGVKKYFRMLLACECSIVNGKRLIRPVLQSSDVRWVYDISQSAWLAVLKYLPRGIGQWWW